LRAMNWVCVLLNADSAWSRVFVEFSVTVNILWLSHLSAMRPIGHEKRPGDKPDLP
jgi:hypothetical protein